MSLKKPIPLSKSCPSGQLWDTVGFNPSKHLNIFKYCSEAVRKNIYVTFELSRKLIKRRGVYSTTEIEAAGFQFTEEDVAVCISCGFKVTQWTADVKPFDRHAKEKPDCPFVQSIRTVVPLHMRSNEGQSTTNDDQPNKRPRLDGSTEPVALNPLIEVDILQKVRKRTFSHWSSQMSPSPAQMIQAGFFSCNVGDRVICPYCNLIAQQWSACGDDPLLIHKTLSPKCRFIRAIEVQTQQSSIVIVNNQTGTDQQQGASPTDLIRYDDIVFTAACHQNYVELPRREASFAAWPKENHPSVESLVRAGFFYTGSKTIVTCFYCNGSLQNWGPTDDPKIEHARWFPNCAYAKQLCGKDLYDRIQATKRAQQERNRANNSAEPNDSSVGGGRGTMTFPDESLLSRYVAARLDLRVSQQLLLFDFKISIIKRCWEDQFRLKHDDFQDWCELFVACTVLQKQIDCIGGKKENITIPSVAMSKIREAARNNNPPAATLATSSSTVAMETTNTSTTSTSSSTGSVEKMKTDQSESSESNRCFVCFEEPRRLACIPCGHLVACVPCGHSLRLCPICRQEIEAFVRIYL